MNINPFDETVLHAVNHATHHSYSFDLFVSILASSTFLGGGWLTLFFWWYWFTNDERKKKRELVACTLFSAYTSLVVARVISLFVPWRARPLTDPPLDFIPSKVLDAHAFVEWSSFPSDHAVLFFAIAAGLFCLSKRIGTLVFLYVAILICLPRIYLGIHYPTDIIAGAVIGLATTWAVVSIPRIRDGLGWMTTKWEAGNASSFYVSFYLLSFLLAVKFNELKGVVKPIFLFLKGTN